MNNSKNRAFIQVKVKFTNKTYKTIISFNFKSRYEISNVNRKKIFKRSFLVDVFEKIYLNREKKRC